MQSDKMKKVLLVDDDTNMFLLIKLMLGKMFDVECISNADTVLDAVNANKYDLILMDINLGRGRNGIDLLNEIRSLKDHEHIPVIAVTAFAMVGDRDKFLELGFNEYISKPFNKTQLINTLERFHSLKLS